MSLFVRSFFARKIWCGPLKLLQACSSLRQHPPQLLAQRADLFWRVFGGDGQSQPGGVPGHGRVANSRHEKAAVEYYEQRSAKLTPAVAILLAIPLYLWNFAPHPFRPGPGESKAKWFLDVPFFLFLLVLELIGAIIKPFALCMRLFANMVAGHVVLAVLISLIVAVPTLWMQFAIGIPIGILHLAIQLLELFVAVLQAYIFTFLTTLFLASAVAPEH